MDSAIMPRIPVPSTASRSPTSRAKSSPTRFRSIPFSQRK